MKFWKKNWYFIVGFLLIILAVIFSRIDFAQTSLSQKNLKNENMDTELKKVMIGSQNGDVEFKVEVADDPIEISEGLMYRKSLAEDKGMLFIFEKVDYVNFWMKNTLIPLDMIFIDQDDRIAHIASEVQPCLPAGRLGSQGVLECPLYPSELPVKYVLEINSGLSKKYGFKNGNLVKFDF